MIKLLRSVLRAATPVGLIDLKRTMLNRRTLNGPAGPSFDREFWHTERRKRIRAVSMHARLPRFSAHDYEGMINYLTEQGISEFHVREGSIPLKSLRVLDEKVFSMLASDRPSFVLHVGNFVGVSLAYITNSVIKRNDR